MVGLYEGSRSREKAEADGLRVGTVDETAEESDIVMVLIPDHLQADVYKQEIAPHLGAGKTLMFAHGFNIHYGTIAPAENIDVSMVAPKAPGHRMREVFTRGSGVPGLLAIHQDASGSAHDIGLAYARGVGCTRAGVLTTTFKEETETDLFGSRPSSYGGVTAHHQGHYEIGFETLVRSWLPAGVGLLRVHALSFKLIVDLLYQGGMEYMRYSISDTAEYGDLTRGPVVVDEHVKENMKKVLEAVQDGSFAREWIPLCRERRGTPPLHNDQLRKEAAEHSIEKESVRSSAAC